MRTGARRQSPARCDVHDHLSWVFEDVEGDSSVVARLWDLSGLAGHPAAHMHPAMRT